MLAFFNIFMYNYNISKTKNATKKRKFIKIS